MKEKKKFRLSLTSRRAVNGYLFILPWLIGFLTFYVRSIVQTIRYSFSTLEVLPNGGYSLTGAGWYNYYYAFRVHASFKQTLVTSLSNMLVDVPLIIFFSLFMAMVLNRKFKGRTLVRAIFFLPVILNSGAILDAIEISQSMVAGGLTSASAEIAAETSGSAANLDYYISLFKNLALPDKVLDYIVEAVDRINDIISASGVQIIIFIAALQSIPGSMYEVAKIEGATGYETFWKVTFPMVMPHIITCVVYTVVDKFAESDVIDLAYTVAFSQGDYGLSSVFSIVSTIITCIILVVVVRFIQKRTFYYN